MTLPISKGYYNQRSYYVRITDEKNNVLWLRNKLDEKFVRSFRNAHPYSSSNAAKQAYQKHSQEHPELEFSIFSDKQLTHEGNIKMQLR